MAFQDPNSDAGSVVASGSLAGAAGGLAAAEGLSLVNSGFQYYNQKKLNRQAQKMTQENMRLQQQLNLDSQYKSIANSTSAYKAAGLNPALAFGAPAAAGVSSAPGNAGAAGMPASPDVAGLMSAGAQLDMLATQKENVQANTNLQNEEAREKKIANDRKASEDYTINEHLPHLIEYMKQNTDDEFTLGWLDEFNQNSKNLLQDKGTLDALQSIFFEMTRQNRNKALDELTNEMDISVMRMQLNNGTAAALADLPKANRRLIYKNMLRMDAEIARFNAETRNVQEDTKFFNERREQTAATVAKLGQETLAILHGDKVALYDAGEIGALGLTLGFDAVSNFANGAGFGTGIAVAGKLAGAKSSGASLSSLPSVGKGRSIKGLPDDVAKAMRSSIDKRFPDASPAYKEKLFKGARSKWLDTHPEFK